MNNKLLIGLLVLVAGVGVGWYVLKGSSVKEQGGINKGGVVVTPTETIGQESITPATAAAGTGESVATTTVTYTDSGFTPKTITVAVGTAVTFMNQSSAGMWVASAVHPTHQLLPGFDQLKSVGKGEKYTYTFAKVGTWKYHNHVSPSDIGTVVVTE